MRLDPDLPSRLAFNKTHRLLMALAAILLIGFLAVNFLNFQVSRKAVREALVEHELPLTSDNIYSEIQASLLRPIYISSLMAHDTFLKDWMVAGEHNPSKVTRYLHEIQRRYDVFSTFVVSALTRRYYHFNGILKEVSPASAKDQWFFTMENHDQGYRVDLDTNEAASNQLTIFVNHKIHDDTGRFIGVTGLGLDVTAVAELIEHYRSRYGREIFFVDRRGVVKSHRDDRFVGRVNIREKTGLGSVADEILSGEDGSTSYTGEDGQVFVRYRFIPELDWYLVVESPEKATLAPLRRSLYTNLLIGSLITLLVLVISGYTVHRFQARLERLATIDPLSGLFNRHFFEALFENAVNTARRYDHKLALILFDIDLFKAINDEYGHLVGDAVIKQVATILKTGRRETDIASRWGGDEFAMLLTDCDSASAERIAEDLRRRVPEEVHVPHHNLVVTISLGVASWRRGEDLQDLTARADVSLYAAKEQGRNCVASDSTQVGIGEPAAHARA